jgi:glycosyltransferase involved in cell wall biosynthesis
MKNFLTVNIVMVTYNQEKYIGKAIESVLMQKTNHSFNLIIGEDCSTDNTNEICKEYASKYPNRIMLLANSKNLGLVKNYLSCFQQCTGKYIAVLEGDDYWTDPLKLQKQVELMERDESIGLVHTNYKILNEHTERISSLPKKVFEQTLQFQGDIFAKLIKQNFICAVTVMFRRNILDHINFNPFVENSCNTIDLIIYLQCAMINNVAFLQDQTAVYRVSSNSVSNNSNFEKIEKFAETKYFIRKYYLDQIKVAEYNIIILKKSLDVFLLFKAIKTKEYSNIIKYLKRFSLTGLFSCIKEWRIYN